MIRISFVTDRRLQFESTWTCSGPAIQLLIACTMRFDIISGRSSGNRCESRIEFVSPPPTDELRFDSKKYQKSRRHIANHGTDGAPCRRSPRRRNVPELTLYTSTPRSQAYTSFPGSRLVTHCPRGSASFFPAGRDRPRILRQEPGDQRVGVVFTFGHQ